MDVQTIELAGFSYDQLRQTSRPDRAPGGSEVKVRVFAASLNFRDHMVITGGYGLPESVLPFVPVSDGAGEVIAVGPDVTDLKVGDRVTTLMTRDWISGPLTPARHAAQNGGPLDGVLAESIILPERALVCFSDHLDYHEAATLPIAALTAWSALREAAVRPGDTVLVTGSGGVALFALQLAQLFGARVIVTTGQPEQRGSRLTALGAMAVIDYRQTDWPSQVVEASGGGVDVVVETAGMRTVDQSLGALRQGGFVALIGLLASNGSDAPDVTLPLIVKNARLRGILTGSRDAYEEMMRAVSSHQLRPIIDRRFAFSDARAAFDHALNGRPFGKVVIDVS